MGRESEFVILEVYVALATQKASCQKLLIHFAQNARQVKPRSPHTPQSSFQIGDTGQCKQARQQPPCPFAQSRYRTDATRLCGADAGAALIDDRSIACQIVITKAAISDRKRRGIAGEHETVGATQRVPVRRYWARRRTVLPVLLGRCKGCRERCRNRDRADAVDRAELEQPVGERHSRWQRNRWTNKCCGSEGTGRATTGEYGRGNARIGDGSAAERRHGWRTGSGRECHVGTVYRAA